MSRRTQITLTDAQYDLLHAESGRTGVSVAEYVRRAIDATYRPRLRPRVGGYELSLALHKGVDEAAVGRRASGRPRGMQFGSRRGPVDDP